MLRYQCKWHIEMVKLARRNTSENVLRAQDGFKLYAHATKMARNSQVTKVFGVIRSEETGLQQPSPHLRMCLLRLQRCVPQPVIPNRHAAVPVLRQRAHPSPVLQRRSALVLLLLVSIAVVVHFRNPRRPCAHLSAATLRLFWSARLPTPPTLLSPLPSPSTDKRSAR